MKWLDGNFVGKTTSLDGAFTFQKDLDFACWSYIKATPLSGNMVLLTGDKQETIKEFLKQEASSLSFWFEDIKEWKPKMAVGGEEFV